MCIFTFDVASEGGCIAFAAAGHGTFLVGSYDSRLIMDLLMFVQIGMKDYDSRLVAPRKLTALSGSQNSSISICHSFEASHSSGNEETIYRKLGEKVPLRFTSMDSQCKYVLVAMNECQMYVRMAPLNYREKIWDHAPGYLVVKEAGGLVVDTKLDDILFDTNSASVAHQDGGGIIAVSSPQVLELLKCLNKE